MCSAFVPEAGSSDLNPDRRAGRVAGLEKGCYVAPATPAKTQTNDSAIAQEEIFGARSAGFFFQIVFFRRRKQTDGV